MKKKKKKKKMANNPDTPTPEFVRTTTEKVTKQVESFEKDMSHRNFSTKRREQNYKENLIEARVHSGPECAKIKKR